MIYAKQVKGAQSAANERVFIRDAKAKLAKAGQKLAELEQVVNRLD